MTTGGYDPNEKPEGEQPADPNGPPPQGNYPPPPQGPGGNPPQGPGGYPPPPGNYPPPPQQGQGGYPPPPGNYPPPPGNYPPPPGNYPPPPGNYPPPPGNYPPPPPFQQQQAGGPGSGQLSVGDAISYAWKKFSENALVWIGIVIIALVISAAIQLIFGGGFSADGDGAAISVLSVIGGFISTIVGYLIQAAFIRGALHEVDGNKPAFGSFFQFSNVASVIIASLIVGIASMIGFFLLIIPGLVVVFLTWFTLQFVVDQNQQPIDAIKSSFQVISQNAGPLLLLALALVGINILGAIPCGIGLLITLPMTIIASTYAYRVLTQRYVSAA